MRTLKQIESTCYKNIMAILDGSFYEKKEKKPRTIKSAPKKGRIESVDVSKLMRKAKKSTKYLALDQDKEAILAMLKVHKRNFVAKAHGVSNYVLNQWIKRNG